ncbi:MAG: SUMF1/EgtB/PvdO family nonheme iron enzyme [Anaerolineales bacterium]|nr:SUMF1/EgtB/PvdO family nonheme iron enzyme [Anaerolineales bacterium]
MIGTSDFSKEASIGLIKRIPAGYLHVGSRYHPREQPRRVVYVAEFEMAHAPVTVNQYAAFLNSEAVKEQRWWDEQGWRWVTGGSLGWGRENRWQPEAWEIQRRRPYHPVVGVTWFEARAYCAWVSAERKRAVRLPSEEEWEYAARGEDGRPYPWGDIFDPSYTNTLEADHKDTVEVTSKTEDVSPFGLMDMAGNVQEWTNSSYKPLAGEVYSGTDLRIARGGSYNDTAYGARTSYRRAYPPGYYFTFLGFRVAVEDR